LKGDPTSVKGTAKEKATKEIRYQVKEGDTLWGIAKKYNLTIAEIKQWNGLQIDRIRPADQLLLKVGEIRFSIPD
jgi:LysM repeat protein